MEFKTNDFSTGSTMKSHLIQLKEAVTVLEKEVEFLKRLQPNSSATTYGFYLPAQLEKEVESLKRLPATTYGAYLPAQNEDPLLKKKDIKTK